MLAILRENLRAVKGEIFYLARSSRDFLAFRSLFVRHWAKFSISHGLIEIFSLVACALISEIFLRFL
jgi:hypothetical protein